MGDARLQNNNDREATTNSEARGHAEEGGRCHAVKYCTRLEGLGTTLNRRNQSGLGGSVASRATEPPKPRGWLLRRELVRQATA